MSIRLAFPRHTPRLLLPSIRQSNHQIPPVCLRSLSVSTHEQPSKPSMVPSPSSLVQPSSSLRETHRPETLHPLPSPPQNDTASATSIITPTIQASPPSSPSSAQVNTPRQPNVPKQPKFTFKPLKAALTLSPNAISRLKQILDEPSPKLVRVGVKNRGCAGLAYHLEYVDKPGKFDEIVEQDGTTSPLLSLQLTILGVKVLIDSKALFSIIGSTMDFVEDRLSARFVFDNPHVKGSCGCGESFSVS
jgi:iron-sulfur cluster assembly 1